MVPPVAIPINQRTENVHGGSEKLVIEPILHPWIWYARTDEDLANHFHIDESFSLLHRWNTEMVVFGSYGRMMSSQLLYSKCTPNVTSCNFCISLVCVLCWSSIIPYHLRNRKIWSQIEAFVSSFPWKTVFPMGELNDTIFLREN